MRVVIAPDKFKGSLSARAVADAIAAGVRRRWPDGSVVCRPVADGGEGTVEALVSVIGGRVEHVDVHGPLRDPVQAGIGWLDDERAVVEVSSAVGLGLIPCPDPLNATSLGCGELIARVVSARRRTEVVVGVGGSASTDGGTGAATALGWRFVDRHGRELAPGGGPLIRLAAIDSTRVSVVGQDARIVGAVDVDSPLLGERGSARVFAPQKGASEDDVEVLEEAMAILSERIRADLGIDVSTLPGGGGAGGIGAGLVAFFGAELRPGFEVVADAADLAEAIRGADLVITGEGRLDEGSLGGKAPAGVARLAETAGVPCIAVAGEVTLSDHELRKVGIRRAVALRDRGAEEDTFADAARLIADATAEVLVLPGFP